MNSFWGKMIELTQLYIGYKVEARVMTVSNFLTWISTFVVF